MKKQSNNNPNEEKNFELEHMDNSEKEYYLSKLLRHNEKLMQILLLNFLLILLDLCVCYLYKYLFQNKLNYLNIISLFLWTMFCCCAFRKPYDNLEIINIKMYKNLKLTYRISFFIYLINALNICYIILYKIIIKKNIWQKYFRDIATINEIVLTVIGIFIYLFLNIIIPSLIMIRFSKIKKLLKIVGGLQGIEYSVTYTIDNNIHNNQLGLEDNNIKNNKVEIK